MSTTTGSNYQNCDACGQLRWTYRSASTPERQLCMECDEYDWTEAGAAFGSHGQPLHNPLLSAPFTPTVIPVSDGTVRTQVMSQGIFHVRLRITKGTDENRDLFHILLHKVDSDYPLEPMRKRTDTIFFCKSCNGMVWKNPSLHPKHIKLLGRQVGVAVKVDTFKESYHCGAMGVERRAVSTLAI